MGNKQSVLPWASPPPPTSILCLPDEIVVEILSHLPITSLTSVPFVCRRFSQLIHYFLPRRLNPTLHLFHFSSSHYFISTSTPLSAIPNWSPYIRRSLPRSFTEITLLSLGRFIYILGYRLALRYDTWNKTAFPVALTLSPRNTIAAAAVNAKIYLAGGLNESVEEYDPSANKWRVVSKVPQVRSACVGAGACGVFYIIDTEHPGLMDALNVSTGEWLSGDDMPAPIPCGGNVVGACATPAGHVYIIISDLGFWRWKGRGEEWERLEGPVLPRRLDLAGQRVRFQCMAAGDDKLLALVNVNTVSCGAGWIGRDVLAYGVVDGQWSRGPNLPFDFYPQPTLAFTQC